MIHASSLALLIPKVFEDVIAGTRSSFSALGLVIALSLVLALRLLLPRAELGRLRVPIAMIAVHIVLVIASTLTIADSTSRRVTSLGALLFLLLAIGRSGFLLVVDALLIRRFARPIPKIFRDILEGLVYTAAILVVLRSAGAQLDALLTTSALLTAVIGLSLQDTLGNLFAGLAIQAQMPFEVDDWIQYGEDRTAIGRVMEINWRATKVITLDEIEIIIPNGPLSRAPIRNFSKPTPASRRSIRVVVPFSEAPHRVHDLLSQTVVETTGVRKHPPPTVVTEAFEERGVRYWLRYWIDDYARREFIDGLVRERVWYTFRRAGVPFAVPVAELELTQDDEHARELARVAAHSHRRTALSSVDFLQVLSPDQLEKLAQSTRERPYAPGEYIIRKGDRGEDFFIVLRGDVAVVIGDGTEAVEVARLDAGSFFGEMSAITGERRSATVRAVSDTLLIVVDKTALKMLLEETPELAERISDVLTARKQQLDSASSMHQAPKVNVEDCEDRRELLHRIKQFFSLSN